EGRDDVRQVVVIEDVEVVIDVRPPAEEQGKSPQIFRVLRADPRDDRFRFLLRIVSTLNKLEWWRTAPLGRPCRFQRVVPRLKHIRIAIAGVEERCADVIERIDELRSASILIDEE